MLVSSFLRLLNVVVPWEDLKEEYYKEFKKIKSQYSIQGFRKGKVPDNILRKHAGKSIDSHFVDHATNIYYKDALNELKNSPLFSEQIINIEGNISSIIAYLSEDESFNDIICKRDKLKEEYALDKSNNFIIP